jgi:hypothetical protein
MVLARVTPTDSERERDLSALLCSRRAGDEAKADLSADTDDTTATHTHTHTHTVSTPHRRRQHSSLERNTDQ